VRVHPNDFLTLHGEISRRNLTRCTSCHTTQSFCTECHSRLGISPMSAPIVSARARFHPPADVWVRGPVLHGRAARRSMNDCVSCHAERDCVTCHGALGVGGGVSPHPPGFVDECRQFLEANARACRSCHVDVGELALRCR
jgi:hypothetical protein